MPNANANYCRFVPSHVFSQCQSEKTADDMIMRTCVQCQKNNADDKAMRRAPRRLWMPIPMPVLTAVDWLILLLAFDEGAIPDTGEVFVGETAVADDVDEEAGEADDADDVDDADAEVVVVVVVVSDAEDVAAAAAAVDGEATTADVGRRRTPSDHVKAATFESDVT